MKIRISDLVLGTSFVVDAVVQPDGGWYDSDGLRGFLSMTECAGLRHAGQAFSYAAPDAGRRPRARIAYTEIPTE